MATVDLDKSFNSTLDSHGSIQLRVVVLKPKPPKDDTKSDASSEPISDEPIEPGASPLGAYLERKSHGKMCIVFLINGQRHDAWDNGFIVRNLGFKYLRTRTMIIVDLDGLAHEAVSEIVQGSRQGLYEGNVMGAITDRMVATLKKDPDLLRLQTEAEQEISELQAGDEVVKQKLDELIDAHHTQSTQASKPGADEPGPKRPDDPVAFGRPRSQDVIVQASPNVGDQGSLPVLVANPATPSIRLRTGTERTITVTAEPTTSWSTIEAVECKVHPSRDGLALHVERKAAGIDATLKFAEPDDFEVDAYPVVTKLRVFAKFKGHEELRELEREIVISKKKDPPGAPKPKPALLATPTFLRVVTPQPIELLPGGPSAHVRVRWDGLDSLTQGGNPPWRFSAKCLTLGTFPTIGHTAPRDGRFELLLDTPRGILPKQLLDFEVEAIGPSGQHLVTMFQGESAEPPPAPPAPEPRKVSARAPEALTQRRPPYELKYVHEGEWEKPTCWGETEWTKEDAGAFTEPTESSPLTLIINADCEPLKEFRDGLVKRNLDESTVRERVTKYTAHVAFHLYQQYRFAKLRREAQAADPSTQPPSEEDMRLEINRVSNTLLKLMEVASR